jgi:hypothetical protein
MNNFDLKKYLAEGRLFEDKDEQLSNEFSDKFNVKVSSTMWGNNGKIEMITQNDIQIAEFEEMIQWIEDKGYKVNRNQSENLFEYDDDRYFYPRIQFSK